MAALLVTTFVTIAVTLSCCDIMCKSVPGSPPSFLFFSEVRGELGNEAMEWSLHNTGACNNGPGVYYQELATMALVCSSSDQGYYQELATMVCTIIVIRE